jgi:hypothetical protein
MRVAVILRDHRPTRPLMQMLAVMGGRRSLESVDVVLWSTDRTLVLYRECPFRDRTIECILRQFKDKINEYGMDVFVAKVSDQGSDGGTFGPRLPTTRSPL